MTTCAYDPRTLAGAPIGMLHCPECGEMVLAGQPHPDYDIPIRCCQRCGNGPIGDDEDDCYVCRGEPAPVMTDIEDWD